MVTGRAYTPKQIEKLGKEMVDYCGKDDVFHVCQWTDSQGKSKSWWYYLLDKYPKLLDSHNRGMQRLGTKLLQMAARACNPWIYQTFIPMYLKDVREEQYEVLEKETTIKAQVMKDIGSMEPDHPFWNSFAAHMESVKNERLAK